MSVAMVNMDPQKLDDSHYRYKMPAILTKIEGNGNGIKTVIPNIHELCERLKRPEEIVIKFFGNELGTQSTHMKNDDKFLVMGAKTQQQMQEKVYDFITRYILCKSCRSPETEVVVEGKSKLSLTCAACGKKTPLNPGEKTYNLFALYYDPKTVAARQAKTAKDQKAAAAAGEAEASSSPTGPVVAGFATLTPAKGSDADRSIQATAEEREHPVEVLNRLLHNEMPFETLVQKIFQMRTDYNLKEANSVRLVFRAIVSESEKSSPPKFIAALQEHLPLLMRFTDKKPEFQKIVIREVQAFCHKHNIHGKFPMAMKFLLEEGAIDEAELMAFYNGKPSKDVPAEAAADIHRRTAQLVAWVRGTYPAVEEGDATANAAGEA